MSEVKRYAGCGYGYGSDCPYEDDDGDLVKYADHAAAIAAKDAEIERLRNALEFYATGGAGAIALDGGMIATTALAEIGGADDD